MAHEVLSSGDAQGLHSVRDEVKTMRDAPEASNILELKASLGFLNYYGTFFAKLVNTSNASV